MSLYVLLEFFLDVEILSKNDKNPIEKATLCACRIIRKEPEMIENYINLIPSLLNDKNHGVMLAAVSLVTEICNISPDYTNKFRRTVPQLVRMLKQLIMSGAEGDNDTFRGNQHFSKYYLKVDWKSENVIFNLKS